MADLLTGMYHNRSSAEEAVDKLENLGYKREDISVVMHDRTRAKEFAETTGTTAGTADKAADATKTAAKVGGALAAILAGAAAVATMRQDKTDQGTTTVGAADRIAGGSSGVYDAGSASPSSYSGSGSADTALGNSGSLRTGVQGSSVPDIPDRSKDDKPFIAGPLAAVLLPALGAGLLSAFSKAGIPKEHAERYAQGLESGGIVVGVQGRPGDETRIRQILNS